jgi:DNA-binding NarL/FixJ family response regulator
MKPYSVLIIEDRPDIATRLKTAVAAHASLVVGDVCWTLDHGLQRLFDLKPRVVLVDLGLPDGSGIEAIKAVAAAEWEVDALVISVFGDEARVVEAIQAGARGYILKGGDLGQVGDDIQTLIDGGSPISPAIARHVLNLLSDHVGLTSGLTSGMATGRVETLTPRETEILRAIARGYKRREIGDQLGISGGTVGNHITQIYRKLKVSSNTEAVVQAAKNGMI